MIDWIYHFVVSIDTMIHNRQVSGWRILLSI